MSKKFIEESFPVREVSEHSSHEKYIRQGHISTLHLWWARRPLASSMSTNYAALIPYTEDIEEWNKAYNFIVNLSKWENPINYKRIKKAREEVLIFYKESPPKVLDPFSGGGAIPFEAIKLGCETYANDYNPVAVLIEKCTLEYPQVYGEKIVLDVQKWANIIYENSKSELELHYPEISQEVQGPLDKYTIIQKILSFIWVRVIKCENPLCGAEIPLFKQFWLANSSTKKISLFPYVEESQIRFKIVGTGYEKIPKNFKPNDGFISRGIAICKVCNRRLDNSEVRKQFENKKDTNQLIAVVYKLKGKKGKKYRIATKEDKQIYVECKDFLKKKNEILKKQWPFEPIPDEKIPIVHSVTQRPFAARENYYLMRWGDLFNSRQMLAALTFIEKIKEAHALMLEEFEPEYAKVIVSYLALNFDKMISKMNNLARWNNIGQKTEYLFDRQALSMIFDYSEINPISNTAGSWNSYLKYTLDAITYCCQICPEKGHIQTFKPIITNGSATNLPYEDNYFDAIFTDPPYYDNVPYAYLSDFFYVWLKRILGELHPDLFSTPFTPKTNEIVAYLKDDWTKEEGNEFYEKMMQISFQEMNRVLKQNGIAIIVYAHKTTEGWENIINALINSGLVVTASWPISTEMKGRLRETDSAALTSSIYIIARKVVKEETGLFPEIKKKMKTYMNKKLEKIWQEGISGVDFFISAIGAGMEVFGKYQNIIDYEGNEIKAKTLLGEVRKIVTNFALRQILHDDFSGQISAMTRFYLLWRWNFQEAKVEFNDANKLAQSIGIKLDKEWNKGFIHKGKKFIKIIGPQARIIDELQKSDELIDVLHHILLLWEQGNRELMIERLSQTYNENEVFYKVAQAISQTLADNSKEKQLIDGFLSGKERIKESIKEIKSQDKIDRWTK